MEQEEKSGNTISQTGGSPFSDPSYNVIQLVNSEIKHLHEVIALNKEITNLHVTYGDKLRLSDEKLSLAESKRIDAIRSVDIGNVAIASEKTAQQAVVLADQLTKNAEQLRNLVLTTAAQQQEQVIAPLMERVRGLENAQYEGIGKGRVADPIMSELLTEVKSLRETRSVNTGKSLGIGQMITLILSAATLIGIIGGLIAKFF